MVDYKHKYLDQLQENKNLKETIVELKNVVLNIITN